MTRSLVFSALFSFAFFSAPMAATTDGPFDAVIIGDSLSTGGGSHPALRYDTDLLWDVFNGRVDISAASSNLSPRYQEMLPGPVLARPQRLWPTMREFFGGPDWVYRHLLSTLSQKYLDTEEYSWGYLAARELGVEPERLAIAAEDGARIAAMPRQIDRTLAVTGGRLPSKVFIFFSGNDLCGIEPSLMTTAGDFAIHLNRGLEYLARAAREQGVIDVYLLSFMSMGQLLDSQEILTKKIVAFGQETTCAELRKSGYRPKQPVATKVPVDAWYFSMAMPPNPAAFCPTVFAPQRFAGHTISTLANRIREYRVAEKKVVDEFVKLSKEKPESPQARLRLHYVTATAGLSFSADEVGEDCFHLSLRGQEKVAQAVVSELSALSAPEGQP